MIFWHNRAKHTDPPSGALAGVGEQATAIGQLRQRCEQADFPEHVLRQAHGELERLDKTDPLAAEYGIGLNYLELLLTLPWRKHSPDIFDIERAENLLAQHHYGLGAVKERVLEHLAARMLKCQEKPRLLIVDDEEIARVNMCYYLERQGYATELAANGEEALRHIEGGAFFDIVITDLKMDTMDGMSLLEWLTVHAPRTRVIMVTGYATVGTAVDALRKGAAHYLTKPVQLEELGKTVRDILDRRRLHQLGRGPVLCLAGPPGTGKTSIGRAIAAALGRTYVRVSMAGLRDEAEIRGHRRTYVGAMPGRIIGEIKRAGMANPCFMLDEIDKAGKDFRGDLASVLLELLDPEQNNAFIDHYLDIPFDLSPVMFLATANNPGLLPEPLLDRLELINFPGYTEQDKLAIARHHLLPRQIAANGLLSHGPEFNDSALTTIISGYTREAGVRGLEREIGTVCRKLARTILRQGELQDREISPDIITALLGPCRFRLEVADGRDRVGVITSLVWTSFGGQIMFVEAQAMPGHSQLILTGSLGEVLRESAHTALSYIRGNAALFGLAENFFAEQDIHIHLPAGEISKDGPSAGAAIALAVISLLRRQAARRQVAVTGEMTLTGQILPVGGIREKILAAGRAGATKVLLPLRNREETLFLAGELCESIELVFVDTLPEMVEHILPPSA